MFYNKCGSGDVSYYIIALEPEEARGAARAPNRFLPVTVAANGLGYKTCLSINKFHCILLNFYLLSLLFLDCLTFLLLVIFTQPFFDENYRMGIIGIHRAPSERVRLLPPYLFLPSMIVFFDQF